MPRLQVVVPCLVVLAVSGCRSESVEQVAAAHREAVEKTFAGLRAIEPLLPAVPEFTEAKVQPLAVPVVVDAKKMEDTNALFVYQEDLAKPGLAAPVRLRTLDSAPLLHCGSLLAQGKLFGLPNVPGPKATASYLGACERARYALVIRTRELVEPVASQAGRFVAGHIRGEVLVYELGAAPKLVGGYPFAAQNSEDITFLEGQDRTAQLFANLESALFISLREATRSALAGSLPPPLL